MHFLWLRVWLLQSDPGNMLDPDDFLGEKSLTLREHFEATNLSLIFQT